MRLLPIDVRDWLLRQHVATNGYVDPESGDSVRFDTLPDVHDPERDQDAR